MSKITRKAQKIFGQNAGAQQLGVFGSLAAGSIDYSSDPDDIQSLSNFLSGWYAGVVGNKSPAIQDMNSLFYLFAYQLAYLFQAGIPEWNATTTYYIGSWVTDGTGKQYRSLTNANLNNLVSDTVNWVEQISLTPDLQSIVGIKKFTSGISNIGNTNTANADTVLLNTDNRIQNFTSFTAARSVTLPTTGILKNEIWMVSNATAFDCTLKSSNGNIIGASLGVEPNGSYGIFNGGSGAANQLSPGYMIVRALKDTPTAGTDWAVVDYFSEYIHATTFEFNAGGSGTTSSFSLKFVRRMEVVCWRIPTPLKGTASGSPTALSATVAPPAQYRPPTVTGVSFPVSVLKNSVFQSVTGYIRITNVGSSPGGVDIYPDNNGGVWTAGSSGIQAPSDYNEFVYSII